MSGKKTNKSTNKNAVRLTLDDLLNKKLQRESVEVKFKELYVSKLDGNLLFKVPNEEETFDYIDSIGEDKSTRNIKEVYSRMIVNCCELLRDKALKEQHNIKDPLDIVTIFFSTKDIFFVGNELMSETGFGEKEEEVKK